MPDTLPPHVQWLVDNRGAALRGVLDAQGVRLGLNAALAVMVAADPSPGAHAVQWLCTALIEGGLRWEDMAAGAQSKAGETLRLFSQHRAALGAGYRNLEDYRELGAVYRAVQPVLEVVNAGMDEVGGRAARRAQRLAARQQSIIVHESAHLIAAIPLSREASCWWGRGTRWCTAADNDNMFAEYNRVAPLIVLCMRDALPNDALHQDAKLQLYLDTQDGQVTFMDALDTEVTPEYIDQHWAVLEPVLAWVMDGGWNMCHMLPQSRWHGRFGEQVMEHEYCLARIAVEHRTAAICRAAVLARVDALEYVPPHLLDAHLCSLAVYYHPMSLEHVPDSLMSPELCALAVDGDGDTLRHVPTHLRTPQMLVAAVSSSAFALREIPLEERTLELCQMAVQGNGSVIRDVPRELWSPELVMEAVQSSGWAIDAIPEEWRTHDLRMAAVRRDGCMVNHFDNDVTTTQMCLAAVRQDPRALLNMSEEFRTHEVCRAALEGDGSLFSQVPNHVMDAELWRVAVAKTPDVLDRVPLKFRDADICLAAVHQYPDMLGSVGRDILEGSQGNQICWAAIKADPWALQYMSSRQYTREILMHVVHAEPEALSIVPCQSQDHDICMAAMEGGHHLIAYVREDLRAGVKAALALLPPPPMPAPPEWGTSALWRASLERLQSSLRCHECRQDTGPAEVPMQGRMA